MKRNSIVRIILFSITIVVLLCILGVSLGANLFMLDGLAFLEELDNDTTRVPMITGDGTTQAVFAAADIRNIEIEWVAGSITLLPVENATQITVTEPEVNQDKYKMVCKQSGSTLKIDFCEGDLTFTGVNIDLTKDLTIAVPADWICEDLEIDTASANVEVSNMTLYSVDFDGASGVCVFTDCSVNEFDIDTASGDVRFEGCLDIFKCSAMSANCHLTVTNLPKRIDVDSMSGDLDLTLPADCGFTVSMDAMSSDFSSDFETTTSNGHHVHGDGSCRINVDAMSGDVIIRKGTGHHDETHH